MTYGSVFVMCDYGSVKVLCVKTFSFFRWRNSCFVAHNYDYERDVTSVKLLLDWIDDRLYMLYVYQQFLFFTSGGQMANIEECYLQRKIYTYNGVLV